MTQRGNGRARTFFGDDDYRFYRDLLAGACREAGVEVWAWVLMPNHTHLILAPRDADGLRRALAPVHRRYARRVHARQRLTGHFWQGRFGSVVMDEDHLAAALRYVALNPVRARLVSRAEDWPWSSVHAHLAGRSEGLTAVAPALSRFPNFADLLDLGPDEAAFERLRRAESIGRPLGAEAFVAQLEAATSRVLRPAKRGRRAAAPRDGDAH